MKKITKILTLSLAALSFFACDDIVAQPTQVVNGDILVNFADVKDPYYDNNFSVIYDKLVNSGTSNSTILNELIKLIATKEVPSVYSGFEAPSADNPGDLAKVFTNVTNTLAGKAKVAYSSTGATSAEALESAISKRVTDTMIDKAKSDSYAKNYLFQEEKLVNELKTSLYEIPTLEGKEYNEDYLITPDSNYEDIFHCDYSSYIEKTIYPDLYKEILTSVYLYNKENSSIGRSYAREVKYIKLDNITDHTDSVSTLIENYFKDAVEGKTPTGDFNLDSLARIYKGVYSSEDLADLTSLSSKENQYALDLGIVTRQDTIDEDLSKVVDVDGNLLAENDRNRDESLTNSYTGSYTYLPSWGKTLKEREIAKLDIVVDDGLVIKSGGVSSLPSALRERLFSSSVANYTTTIEGISNVKFLTPKTVPNNTTDYLSKYAYYDSSSSSYYIAIVGNTYNTTSFKDEANKDVALEIARTLGKTSTNQKDTINYYLDKYDLKFGDQDFYDYIESTYPDVLDDNYSYGKED